MRQSYVELLADRQTLRFVNIIYVLSSQNHYIAIDDIACTLKTSRKIIESDIEAINHILPFGIQIQRKKRSGLRLVLDVSTSVDDAISTLLVEGAPFKILDDIFHNRSDNILEWENLVFVSKTTLYKIIKDLNTRLAFFGLSLDTKRVALTGREIDIRYFYFHLYNHFRNVYNIEYEDETLNYFYPLLVSRIIENKIERLHISSKRSLLWFTIFRARSSNGFEITLPDGLMNRMRINQTFDGFLKIYIETVCEVFHITSLSVDEATWFYVGVLESIIYKESEFILTRVDKILEAPKIEAFLEFALPTFSYPAMQSDQSYYIHSAYLTNLFQLSLLTNLYQQQSFDTIALIENSHPQIYTQWLTLLPRLHQTLPMFVHLKDIAATLTMISVSCMQNGTIPKRTKILFSIDGDAGYPNYLATLCKTIIPAQVDAMFMFIQIITQTFIDEHAIELLVCNYNYDTPLINCEVMIMSLIPTKQEWLALKKRLDTLHHDRQPFNLM